MAFIDLRNMRSESIGEVPKLWSSAGPNTRPHAATSRTTSIPTRRSHAFRARLSRRTVAPGRDKYQGCNYDGSVSDPLPALEGLQQDDPDALPRRERPPIRRH